MIVQADAFGPFVNFFPVLDPIPRFEWPSHQEIEIDIDSLLLELGDEVVLTVELLKIEAPGVVAFTVDQSPGRGQIEKLKPNCVHAKPGQRSRPQMGVFLRRHHHRTFAPVGNIHPPKADSFSVAGYKMSSLRADESVLPCRPVEQKRNIHRRRSEQRLPMIQGEGLQPGVGLGKQPVGRKQQPCHEPTDTKTTSHGKCSLFPIADHWRLS